MTSGPKSPTHACYGSTTTPLAPTSGHHVGCPPGSSLHPLLQLTTADLSLVSSRGFTSLSLFLSPSFSLTAPPFPLLFGWLRSRNRLCHSPQTCWMPVMKPTVPDRQWRPFSLASSSCSTQSHQNIERGKYRMAWVLGPALESPGKNGTAHHAISNFDEFCILVVRLTF